MMRRLFVAALACLWASGACAAVTVNSAVTPQTPNRGFVQFLPADTPGTYKTMYTAGANGSKCVAMWSNNNDAATHLLTVQIVNTTPLKLGGIAITTVATAGFANAVPPQDLMAATVWPGLAKDSDGNPYFLLISGDTIQATYATAVTASDQVDILVLCADF